MTELQPYRPDLIQPRTDSWQVAVAESSRLAHAIVGTEMVPKPIRNSEPAILATILYGREIGLPPITALRSIYVVDGSVALYAETMRGLILAAGHEFYYVEATTARCTARGKRRDSDREHEVTYTIDDARQAKLTARDNWQKNPRRMLKARATSELASDIFADVTHGFTVLETIDDTDNAPAPATRVTRKAPNAFARPPHQDTPPAPTVSDTGTEPPTGPQDVPLPGEAGYDQIGDSTPPLPVDPPNAAPGEGDTEPRPVEDTPDVSTYTPVDKRKDPADMNPTQRQHGMNRALFEDMGVTDRDTQLAVVSAIVGKEVTSRTELTRGEMATVIDVLTVTKASEHGRNAMLAIAQAKVIPADVRPILEDAGKRARKSS